MKLISVDFSPEDFVVDCTLSWKRTYRFNFLSVYNTLKPQPLQQPFLSISSDLNQLLPVLRLHLPLFLNALSSACRKPQLHSSPTSTRLMIPTRASPRQQGRAPPWERSARLPPRSHLWLRRRRMRKHPSPRTRPLSCMPGRLQP